MRRALHRVVTAACIGGTALGTGAVLSQSPFTAPLVARSTSEVQLALERAMARAVTPQWLAREMAAELARDEPDRDRVEMLKSLAQDCGLILPDPTPDQLAAFETSYGGMVQYAAECAVCAYDILACPSLTHLMGCGIPVELTPLGDINALRRAAMAAISSQDVDQLEVALALVGLGATGLVVVSGGSTVDDQGRRDGAAAGATSGNAYAGPAAQSAHSQQPSGRMEPHARFRAGPRAAVGSNRHGAPVRSGAGGTERRHGRAQHLDRRCAGSDDVTAPRRHQCAKVGLR
ncbi:MAG: hypothetical protein HLUCCA12_10220 [Rhodobacteraceae bacterium HLUCCA12]|nr:MAG: hypothetical protein HLUCCA12_10220 [Rhodobacteraceae bacterium HLUCCA12]